MQKHLLVAAFLITLAGCASSPEKRFNDIRPGMDEERVSKTMGEGPTRFEDIANTQYSSWYWGDDRCVLFKDRKVVAKDSSRTGNDVTVGPGKYEEKTRAQ